MIYLDSCILIYLVEDTGTKRNRILARLDDARADEVAISPLVMHECLVGPLRTSDLERRDRYEAVFDRLRMVDLDAAAFVRAAELRAHSNLRTPDALHLAAAQLSHCDELWTNDLRLAKASHGLAIDVFS